LANNDVYFQTEQAKILTR